MKDDPIYAGAETTIAEIVARVQARLRPGGKVFPVAAQVLREAGVEDPFTRGELIVEVQAIIIGNGDGRIIDYNRPQRSEGAEKKRHDDEVYRRHRQVLCRYDTGERDE